MTRRSRKPSEAKLNKLGALAKLPVFWKLDGKRVVMAGGSAAAAWKVELVAAAGADVEVYAAEVDTEMADLVERGSVAGTITLHERPWSIEIFSGASLALGDAETDAQAQAFYCAARAAGVPAYVIDKPAFCEFQFGSIINRSPVVVSVSTDGAAPILAQAIRQRIETLLPTELAAWAQHAKNIRQAMMQRIESWPQRRRFWEKLVARAFMKPAPEHSQDVLEDVIADVARGAETDEGRVTLVGAGPGDAELLTVKAMRALQAADVILFDDLVSGDVLELARREAKRMLVGKRGRRESCAQEDINALMVKLAKQGKHVVRLKSGDPMIFGRAGEEIERLRHEGILVDVVPGVTAATALASAMGVSLTHRDHAHSVRFVTGHSRAGRLPDDLDWRGLTDAETTVVFYMAGRTAPEIARKLIANGASISMPAVIASAVARPGMMVEHTTLGALSLIAEATAANGPVLLAVGTMFAAEVAGDTPSLLAVCDADCFQVAATH